MPEGGVYEIARALERLARSSGVELKTGELYTRSAREGVHLGRAIHRRRGSERARRAAEQAPRRRLEETGGEAPCSGIAIYAAIRGELPARLSTHGVVLPSDPAALYASLEAVEEPDETMAFVDYYRPGEPYPNRGHVLALGLTAPANGREYGLEDAFVAREVERVSRVIGLPKPATEYFGEHEILHPRYFGAWGSAGGALYGAVKPFWMTGPPPRYSDRKRPWLWRVGASVHPGGGIPAVLGGAMISSSRLLGFLGK